MVNFFFDKFFGNKTTMHQPELWSILHSANLYILQMKQIKGILGTSVESRIF